jgi:hypothetical protein
VVGHLQYKNGSGEGAAHDAREKDHHSGNHRFTVLFFETAAFFIGCMGKGLS